jgi:hypothetical protein
MANQEKRRSRQAARESVSDAEKVEAGPARLYAPGKPHEVESGPSRLRPFVTGRLQTGAAHRVVVASQRAPERAASDSTESGPPRIGRFRH